MLVVGAELRALWESGVVSAPAEAVGAVSVDLTLGRHLLVEHDGYVGRSNWVVNKRLSLRARDPLPTRPYPLSDGSEYVLLPGHFVLAHTHEEFNLPLHITGQLSLTSSAARAGLSHSLAVWVKPGFHGSLTLELHNVSRGHAISLRAGDPLAQVIFHAHASVPLEQSDAARGAYVGAAGVQGAQPQRRGV